MAALIYENGYLVSYSVKEEYSKKDRYLLVVTDLEKDIAIYKDPVLNKINNLKKKLLTRFDTIDEEMQERKAFEEKLVSMLDEMGNSGANGSPEKLNNK